MKRVIRSRGRYQVQTSFGAYKRATRTRRASADRQMATRTHRTSVYVDTRATCYDDEQHSDVNPLDFEDTPRVTDDVHVLTYAHLPQRDSNVE